MSLSEKVVLITGSTGALGRVVTERLLQENADIVAVYNREPAFEDLKKSLESKNNLKGFQTDLTSEKSVDALYEDVLSNYGRVDCLVHLAGGFWMGGLIAETPFRQWDKMISMNLTSTFLICKKIFKTMQNNNGGHIITIAAKPALELPPGMGAYSISKAGVISLTEILAKEGKSFNIYCNSILPGVIDTKANRDAMPDADYSIWIDPGEIAEVIISLCKSSEVSGSNIKMYGGV